MDKAIELAESIDGLASTLGTIQSAIGNLLTRLPLLSKINSDIQLLNTYITRIDSLYDELLYYLENPDCFEGNSHDGLLKTFTSYSQGDVPNTISAIHSLLSPRRLGKFKESLLVLLAKEIENDSMQLCGTGETPGQRLSGLVNIVMDTEMKASVMMSFAYSMRTYLHNENTTAYVIKARRQFLKRTSQYSEVLKDALVLAPNQLRRCDPPNGHERGVTFHEFGRFLQVFIVQEGAMNRKGQCENSCEKWPQPSKVYPGCSGFECGGTSTTCYGQLTACRTLPSKTAVCEYHPLQTRRYSWFESEGQVYGPEEDSCPAGRIYYGSRIDWPSINAKCALCRCICVEDSGRSSSRFISVRKELANVDDNMVITGLQLVMIDKIAHIKIMQGKFGPGGGILENSTSWIEPEAEVAYDDWSALTWERRRFNLDDLKLPENHVVTGVRFRRNWQQTGAPVQLEIQGTSYDPESFQLQTNSTIWVAPDDDKNRVEYEADGFDNPMKSTMTSIDSKPYSFIDLDWSSVVGDAGQTTIPFLDGLAVYADQPVALTGVGLYHKSEPGYGGFLTFVLSVLNAASDAENLEE